MRTAPLFLPLLLLVCSLSCLPAQSPCDTAAISAHIRRAGVLLDTDHLQAAIEENALAHQLLMTCTSDSAFRVKSVPALADLYQSAAAYSGRRGLSNQSIDMSERVIALYRQLPVLPVDHLATAYLNLAYVYGSSDKRELALEAAKKGLEVRKNANPADPKLAMHYEQLVRNHSELNDTATAFRYLQEWEEYTRRPGVKTGMQARLTLTQNKASLMNLRGDHAGAAKMLEDTLSRYGEALRAKGGFVSAPEFMLSELFTRIGENEKAFQYAEKNVKLFEQRLQQQNGKLFGRSHYGWCLAQAAKAAWHAYLQTHDSSWYDLAENRCRRAEDMIFAVRDRAPNDGFRDWMGDDMDIVANIAEVRQGMYALSGNKTHVERAFEAVEASKTFATQQFLHETYALQWGGVPDSLFQKETRFRQEINELETKFFMIRLRPKADSLIALNNEKLFALRDQYSLLLREIEQNYPEYFRLKYTNPSVSLAEVRQKLLRPGQCLLDLYVWREQGTILLVRPDTLLWVAVQTTPAVQSALQLFEAESSRFPEYQNLPEKEYLQRMQAYADASYLLYQTLIEPVRPFLTEEILLIPRNELASVPFGALLTQKESNISKPFLWHFLDNEYVLSQAFSAGLFQFTRDRRREKPKKSLLALAPFAEGGAATLAPLPAGDAQIFSREDHFAGLPNSKEEALTVAQITQGTAIIGAQATKAAFMNQSRDYRILHLATHSAANQVLGEYSFVALQAAPPEKAVDMLYARDIYGLRLSADLVVLSACETALGQFRSGEGIIGLLRAFTCAGARNTIASLWSVNDSSTKQLMILFYKEIKKGAPYNKALATAKRNFIRDNRQFAHPYYWAGFILNGRD